MAALLLLVQLMLFINGCTLLHNRRQLYPRKSQSRSSAISVNKCTACAVPKLTPICNAHECVHWNCISYKICSVCCISRPMLEVRDERPRRRHLSLCVLIAIHVAMSYAYARRESYKIIHALVRRYSLDP